MIDLLALTVQDEKLFLPLLSFFSPGNYIFLRVVNGKH